MARVGDEHERESLANGEAHGLLAHAHHLLERPLLRVLANGRGADERRRLDRESRFLRDARDRLDVRRERARGGVGRDRELRIHYFLRQRERVRARARARAGKPDVRGGDAELRHQVEECLLVFDGWIGDGWRLQPIAQRLVVELHAA